MRVHINGRLPLIKTAVVEYDNGDEVTAHLVYEKLDKHCTYCCKLDHEMRDCLKVKADKREEQAKLLTQAKEHSARPNSPRRNEAPLRQQSIHSNSASLRGPGNEIPSLRPHREYQGTTRNDSYQRSYSRIYRDQADRRYENRGYHGHRYHPYQQQHQNLRYAPKDHRNHSDRDLDQQYQQNEHMTEPTSKGWECSFKELTKGGAAHEESSGSKALIRARSGSPSNQTQQPAIPQAVMAKAT